MNIKIPREFKIGVTKAIVGYKEYLNGDEGYHGSFNRRTGNLHIDSQLTNNLRDKTFGHELMEVIKENYNLHTAEEDMSNIANGWLEFLEQLGIKLDWSDIT